MAPAKVEIDEKTAGDPYRYLLNWIYRIPSVGEKPISALFVGQPGIGKSHLMTNFPSSNSIMLSDTTAAGISELLDDFAKAKGDRSYVMVPDLVKIMARKSSNSFTALMNIGLEEGFVEIATAYQKWKARDADPVNFGLIAAITTDELEFHRRQFESNGFMSRTLVIRYDPNVDAACKDVCRGIKEKVVMVNPEKPNSHKISISEDAAHEMEKVARRWAKHLGEAPLRRINFMRKFSKVSAMMDNSTEVSKDNVIEVYDLLEAVNAEGITGPPPRREQEQQRFGGGKYQRRFV